MRVFILSFAQSFARTFTPCVRVHACAYVPTVIVLHNGCNGDYDDVPCPVLSGALRVGGVMWIAAGSQIADALQGMDVHSLCFSFARLMLLRFISCPVHCVYACMCMCVCMCVCARCHFVLCVERLETLEKYIQSKASADDAKCMCVCVRFVFCGFRVVMHICHECECVRLCVSLMYVDVMC